MAAKTRHSAGVWGKVWAMVVVGLAALLLLSPAAQADEIDDLLSSGGYVEGEAIVAFRDDGWLTAQFDVPYEVTPLMHVEAAAIGEGQSDALQPQSQQVATLSLVASDTLSTEELLRALSDDPRIAFAEPNYVCSFTDITAGAGGIAPQAGNPVDDLTPLQWGNWFSDATTRAIDQSGNTSINVPAFGSDQRGANMEKQVVVALLDTAVDHTNPDLENIIYWFSPEQQEALGCGEWGFNAVGKGANARTFDEGSIALGHGTHTAGILGAEWDGHGTSGVASDVKIVSIELADSEGNESLADALCAFDFVNRFNELASENERIKVTSNSWSEYLSSRALDVAVRELGEKWGIVSIFSAGNDGKNNDHSEKTPSSLADNPYAIIVANTDQTDRLNSGSEYGRATVDLAAPGAAILSTTVPARGGYYPDATRGSNLLYVGFDGGEEPQVTVSQLFQEGKPELCYDETAVCSDIGTVVDETHFFGTNCLKIGIDPSYPVESQSSGGEESEVYDLQLEFDLADTGIAERIEGVEGLYLGMAYAVGTDKGAMAFISSTNAANITLHESRKNQDGEEEIVEVTRPVMSFTAMGEISSNRMWTIASFPITHESFAKPGINPGLDLDVAAVRPEGDKLIVKVRISLPKGCTDVYVDSIGLGTQTVPYEFASGTSMSTPAVAGAAAVLASRGYEGKELAALVRSMVRIPEAGELPVRTGGVFDFTVEGSPDDSDDEEEPYAPVIMEVSVEGTTVTITGENFGLERGSVDLSRYVVGAKLTPVAATISSWADNQVTLELDSDFKGILWAVLTNAGGKHDTRAHFVDKGDKVYEQDLPFDASTADVFTYGDGQGDWETKGPLVGLGCKLYYLPAYEGLSHATPSFRQMRCFDLKTETWSTLPELPEWLQDISAAMYDGTIVVEGATMHVLETGEPSASFPEGEVSEERVYVYDPNAKLWSKASSENMIIDQTIVNDGGQLKLVGGSVPNPEFPDWDWMNISAPVFTYDLETGAGADICDLPENPVLKNPQAAAKDGTILLYTVNGTNVVLTRIQGGQATHLEGSLPQYFLAEDGEPEQANTWGAQIGYPYRAVLAPTTDGFVLVGPPAADGSSDTYVLKDGSDVFEPYELRASEDRVYSHAACTYRGRLFVIGSSWFEPEQRLFRATAMGVPEYPGDIPCEKDEPTPEPTPTPSPTPDRRLPKTDDPTISTPVLVGISVCGVAALAAGIALGRKNRK